MMIKNYLADVMSVGSPKITKAVTSVLTHQAFCCIIKTQLIFFASVTDRCVGDIMLSGRSSVSTCIHACVLIRF